MEQLENISDLEKLLKKLPLHEMRKEKERLFYARLAEAEKQEERSEYLDSARARFSFGRKFAFAFSSALLLLIAVTGFSLLPNVTNGNPLYPVKKAEERVELAFSREPISKINTHLRFAGRRLEELEVLFSGNPELLRLISTAKAHELGENIDPRIEATLHDYFYETSEASVAVSNIYTTEEIAEALEKIEQAEEKHIKYFEKLIARGAEITKPLLNETLSSIEEHQAEVVAKKTETVLKRREGLEKFMVKVTSASAIREKLLQSQSAEEKAAHAEAAETGEIRAARAAINVENRKERAEAEFQKAQRVFESFKEEKQKQASPKLEKLEIFVGEKLDEAAQALSENKYGKVFGLSRATEAMLQNFQAETWLEAPAGVKPMDVMPNVEPTDKTRTVEPVDKVILPKPLPEEEKEETDEDETDVS